MRRYLVVALSFFLILGCSKIKENKPFLVKINNYELSKEEFEDEFRGSSYGRDDTAESREKFLNNLIDRKLILQDAEARDLDKEKNFLKTIEKFWEQSLLKIALDEKSKEIAGSAKVSEQEVREAYQALPESSRAGKNYAALSEQLRWELKRLKESQMLNNWIAQLRQSAQIRVNFSQFKKE